MHNIIWSSLYLHPLPHFRISNAAIENDKPNGNTRIDHMGKEQRTVKLSLVDFVLLAVRCQMAWKVIWSYKYIYHNLHSKILVQLSALFHPHSQDLVLVLPLNFCYKDENKIQQNLKYFQLTYEKAPQEWSHQLPLHQLQKCWPPSLPQHQVSCHDDWWSDSPPPSLSSTQCVSGPRPADNCLSLDCIS